MPERRRRLSAVRVAAVVQLAIAATLAVLLLVAIWKFFEIAGRLPGGARTYIYLPIAMAVFVLLAIHRGVRAVQLLRRGPERQDPPVH